MSTPDTPRHPIRIVAERTGLTPATLRAWERRYGAVEPGRSDGAQRLYSDGDIQRLRLIARLSAIGYSLADLARMSTTALARTARQTLTDDSLDSASALLEARAAAAVTRMLSDVRALDTTALRSALTNAVFTLGPHAALDRVVSPLLDQVGIAWACRDMSVAQEHVASQVVRDVLGWMLQTASERDDGNTFVATTLPGELHEFGAMMGAAVAALGGWRVVYLGPNLPADEIARVAKDARARAIGLSIVAPQPTGALRDELEALRHHAGKRVAIFAGGASASDHRLSMRRASVELVASRTSLHTRLEQLRTAR